MAVGPLSLSLKVVCPHVPIWVSLMLGGPPAGKLVLGVLLRFGGWVICGQWIIQIKVSPITEPVLMCWARTSQDIQSRHLGGCVEMQDTWTHRPASGATQLPHRWLQFWVLSQVLWEKQA